MIDYSTWSRLELIREAKLLNEAYHQLAQEAQRDRTRLQLMERAQKFFEEISFDKA
jgi:hypothetical protein